MEWLRRARAGGVPSRGLSRMEQGLPRPVPDAAEAYDEAALIRRAGVRSSAVRAR